MEQKIAILLSVLTIFLVAFPVSAANENMNQYLGIKPDSPFYFFQGIREGFGGLFKGNDPEFHEQLAMRRQAEMEYLKEQGRDDLIEKRRLQERYQLHMEKAEQVREQQRIREENQLGEQKGETERVQNRTEEENQGEGSGQGSGGSGSGQGGSA